MFKMIFLNKIAIVFNQKKNEGKKEEGIFNYGECEYFFFNSSGDSGAKFWVHFKMKPKF